MWRFAPEDAVKVLSGRSWVACRGLLVRVREGFILMMQGNVWRFAPDEFVNDSSGRSEVACGG